MNTGSCSRPTCSGEPVAWLAYDYSARCAWVDYQPKAPSDRSSHWPLCERHADGLSVPKGWSRVDRRAGARRNGSRRIGTVASGTVGSGTVGSGTVGSGTLRSGTVGAGLVAEGGLAGEEFAARDLDGGLSEDDSVLPMSEVRSRIH
jgi:hypothetical protein